MKLSLGNKYIVIFIACFIIGLLYPLIQKSFIKLIIGFILFEIFLIIYCKLTKSKWKHIKRIGSFVAFFIGWFIGSALISNDRCFKDLNYIKDKGSSIIRHILNKVC